MCSSDLDPPLRGLLSLDADAPLHSSDEVRQAVRDLLRQGGFKPTGRSKPAAEYLVPFRERDILVATAGADVVRFLPPLVVEKDRIDEVVDVFDEILRQESE